MQERPLDDAAHQPTQPLQPDYAYPPQFQPLKPKRRGRTLLIIAGSAVAVLIVAGAVGAATSKSPDNTTRSDAAGPVDPGMLTPGSQVSAVQAVPLLPASSAPASTAPAAPEQVTYSCTGSAPDGVDITYGPDGSDHSASHLPFSHTDPLSQGTLYYVTTAQLQGGGNVSCSTVVQTDNLDGSANQVRKDASADGGYNIASAEVCSGFGGWDPC